MGAGSGKAGIGFLRGWAKNPGLAPGVSQAPGLLHWLLGKVAGGEMVSRRADRAERRRFGATALVLLGMRTAWMKRAP
jgi:hypothetical protein